MIEDLYKSVDRINKAIESGMHNKVNIEFLTKQMNKVLLDIEKLKDKQRSFANGNGPHQ
jgi:aconitase B